MLDYFGQLREVLPLALRFQFPYREEFPSQAELAVIEEFATSLGTIKKTVNDLGRRDCDLIKADRLLSLMLKKLKDSQVEIGQSLSIKQSNNEFKKEEIQTLQPSGTRLTTLYNT